MADRFTIDGSAALERRIAEDLDRVARGVRDAAGKESITALILGGGYGRGEGAVFVENGRETIYNDYDFFVVAPFESRRRRRRLHGNLQEAAHGLSEAVGVEVDIGVPIPEARLGTMPYELMMMELKEGHRVVFGAGDVLSAMPDFDPARVPLAEGARLLMNRATGLLQSRIKAREGDADAPLFAIRNMQKAMLAIGDAVLFIRERYSPSYVERGRRLAALNLDGIPDPERLKRLYAEAIEFKLRPVHDLATGEELRARIEDCVRSFETYHLWYERERLGIPELDWTAYARLPSRLVKPGIVEGFTNAARNIRGRALPLAGWTGLGLHPRDHLLKTLPSVLYMQADEASERAWLRVWERYN